MSKKNFYAKWVLLFLMTTHFYAQDFSWNWITPSIPTNRSFSAIGINDKAFFLCEGEMVISFQGPENKIKTYAYSPLNDVEGSRGSHRIAFADSLTGIVIGDYGVWRTDDGGKHWTQIFPDSYFFGVCTFSNSSTGWLFGVSGGVKTTDGGKTWQNVWDDKLFEFPRHFTKVFGIGNENVWVLKSFYQNKGGEIFASFNGGNSWVRQDFGITSNRSNQVRLFGMAIDNNGIGIITGSVYRPDSNYYRTLIIRSTDFGRHWTSQIIENDSGNYPYVFHVNDSTWILLGNRIEDNHAYGVISVSTDSGKTWTSDYIPFPDRKKLPLWSAAYIPDLQKIIISTIYGYYWESLNFGKTFTRIEPNLSAFVQTFALDKNNPNENQLVAALTKDQKLLVSQDGGLTWKIKEINIRNLNLYSNINLDVVDGNIFIATNSHVFRSRDGGDTWEEIVNTNRLSFFYILNFKAYSSNNLFIKTLTEIVLSYNGGQSWYKIPIKENFWANGVEFISSSRVFVWGEYSDENGTRGAVLDVQDNGNYWRIFDVPFRKPLTHFAKITNTKWILNDLRTVYQSNDKGLNWNIILTSTDYFKPFSALAFRDSLYGLIRIVYYFLETQDGGNTWHKKESYFPIHSMIDKMEFNYRGDLLTLVDGILLIGLTNNPHNNKKLSSKTIQSRVAVNLKIFPNPFNSTTQIQFTLMENSNIHLILFNTLGQVINEVAKGVYPAGHYTFELDGTNLSSGIYFLQFKTGDINIIKKIILIK